MNNLRNSLTSVLLEACPELTIDSLKADNRRNKEENVTFGVKKEKKKKNKQRSRFLSSTQTHCAGRLQSLRMKLNVLEISTKA